MYQDYVLVFVIPHPQELCTPMISTVEQVKGEGERPAYCGRCLCFFVLEFQSISDVDEFVFFCLWFGNGAGFTYLSSHGTCSRALTPLPHSV